jgi:hypothetical protein
MINITSIFFIGNPKLLSIIILNKNDHDNIYKNTLLVILYIGEPQEGHDH